MLKNPIITVEGLEKKYNRIYAVNGISFEVYENEIFGLLGPNGAGKTSTLEILETLNTKTKGKVIIDGYNLDKDPASIKRIIGIQLQSSEFHKTLNLSEIIYLFAGLYNVQCDPIRILKRVNLEDKAKKKYKQLSGGQQQRFSLAITFINNPRIIFLDEPTTGLDPQSRHLLWDIVKDARAKGITIVLTTHYMDEAEVLCDRIGIMDKGKIIAIDSPNNLIDELLAGGFEKKIELKKANLEDVFLSKTGHSLEEH